MTRPLVTDTAPKGVRFTQIEHMRAVAVLVVIVHHLGGMPSGFIGVDIFFVISGFVITHALLASSHLGFVAGLRHFYYRRIIRILPPLLVVTLASFTLGWWLFFDSDFLRLQEAISTQAYFLQNVHFAQAVANYFRGVPSTDLALHSWSLAVEEQFYLLCPALVLLLVWLRRRAPLASTAIGIIVTAAATFFAVARVGPLDQLTVAAFGWFATGPLDPEAVRFYSLPFRAWELLLGCSAMAVRSRWELQLGAFSQRARPIFYSGLAFLLTAAFLDLRRESWPNAYTLAICLVTAACLVLVDSRSVSAGWSAVPGRALAYVGNTSYSAYLWHWPLLGYFTYTNFDFGVSPWDYVLFCLVLSALVAATYLTIEKHRFRLSPAASVAVLVVFVAGAHLLGTVRRNPQWFSPEKQRILASSRFDRTQCVFSLREVRGPFLVLFGDSHMQMVTSQVQRAASTRGYEVLCIEGSRRAFGSSWQATAENLERATASPNYAGTLLALRWNMYSVGFPAYEVEERGNRFLPWEGRSPRDKREALEFFTANMKRLFDLITVARPSRDIAVLLQVPNMPFFAHKEALVDWHGLRFRALPPKRTADHTDEILPVRRIFESLRASQPRVSILDPTPFLCDRDTCAYRQGWNVLYKDDDHLSQYGENLLAPLFDRWVEALDATASDGRP